MVTSLGGRGREGQIVIKGFRDFVLRGNVIDLAVAVVLGAVFGAIITALVDNIINPLIAAIFGQPDITSVGTFTINGANFSIGAVLQAILNFLFVAIAVYVVLVVPMNRLVQLRKTGEEEPPEAPSEEVLLLTQIRDLLGGADTTVVGPPSGDPAPGAPTRGGSAYPPGPTTR
jgi:large conductance mechanosensitive channel